MINHLSENLDCRICDCEEGSQNEQTYREFIIETENKFNLTHKRLHEINVDELIDYLNFLDKLWCE